MSIFDELGKIKTMENVFKYVSDIIRIELTEEAELTFTGQGVEDELKELTKLYPANSQKTPPWDFLINISPYDVSIVPTGHLEEGIGVANCMDKTIQIERHTRNTMFRVLIHEIGHAHLHHFELYTHRLKGVREKEADIVEYIVGAYFGLDISETLEELLVLEREKYVRRWRPDVVSKVINKIINSVEVQIDDFTRPFQMDSSERRQLQRGVNTKEQETDKTD